MKLRPYGALLLAAVVIFGTAAAQTTQATVPDAPAATSKDQQKSLKKQEDASKQEAKSAKAQRKALKQEDKAAKAAEKTKQ